MRNEVRAQYIAPQRPFAQRGVTLNVGKDKVQRGAQRWQTNAGEWYAQYGKVPADVYDFIDAAVKDLAAGTRDWANFLKGKGQTRVTDRLIHDAAVRVENVMFLAHALKELGNNPRFVAPDGRPFIREYIAAKTANVPPFLLPPELIANAKRAGAAIYAEASGAPKATAALKANSDGVRQWLRNGAFTKAPEVAYEAVPLFYGLLPQVGGIDGIDDGLGKPSAKFEFEDETARKDFLDELKKINWAYNVKMYTGGTGGKPKSNVLEKSIFDDAPQYAPAPAYVAPEPKIIQDSEIGGRVAMWFFLAKQLQLFFAGEKTEKLDGRSLFFVEKTRDKIIDYEKTAETVIRMFYVELHIRIYGYQNNNYSEIMDFAADYAGKYDSPQKIYYWPQAMWDRPTNRSYPLNLILQAVYLRYENSRNQKWEETGDVYVKELAKQLADFDEKGRLRHPSFGDDHKMQNEYWQWTFLESLFQDRYGRNYIDLAEGRPASSAANAPEPTPAPEPVAPAIPDGYDVLEGRFIKVFNKYPPPKNHMELRFRRRDGTIDTQTLAIPAEKMIVVKRFDVENKRGVVNCIFAVERKTLDKLLKEENLQPGNNIGLTLQYYSPAPAYVAPEPETQYVNLFVDDFVVIDSRNGDTENELTIPVRQLAGKNKGKIRTIKFPIDDRELEFISRNGPKHAMYEVKIPRARYEELNKYLEAHGLRLIEPASEPVAPAPVAPESFDALKQLNNKRDKLNAELMLSYGSKGKTATEQRKRIKSEISDVESQILTMKKALRAQYPDAEGLYGLSGKPWARFDFRTNDEMREFTEKIERLNWGDSPPRFNFEQPKAAPETPVMFTPDDGARTSDVWLLPVSGVKTDTARFQNRKSEFSEASVERIVANFDENKLDPIVVWRDPENMRTYVLSGHSRLEAHKRLGKDKIKARFFEGTEAEAIRFAKVDANRAATAETVVEDIEAFRLDRDGSANVAPLKKNELKIKWKDKANKLDAYTHLSPAGQFIKTLSQPDLSQWPGIVNKAMWAGELRAMYPHLTDAHEDELFNYMFKTGGSAEKMLKMTKEDLFAKVNDRANSIRFDTDEPLALTKVSTGYEARADTGPALARLKEIRKRIEQIDLLSKQTESKTARAELANEKATLQREAEFIDKDIDFLKSSQNALFGIGAIMQRWERCGYV